jgi:acetyl-CoA synthetase
LRDATIYRPPQSTIERAVLKDPGAECLRAREENYGFWDAAARQLEWFAPWEQVLDWKPPHAHWFVGGKCNITVNCLDRHVAGARRNKIALIWVGEDGTERLMSFGMLARTVGQIANALKGLGVKKGDRVAIYMPLLPESIAAMLACARIGAVHSVVYAGLGAGALRERIEDARAEIVLTTDICYRRGRSIALKPIVDEAVDGLGIVRHVVILSRLAHHPDESELREGRDLDWFTLVDGQSSECPVEIMDAEDPLFILYTSGSTGKPKGCLFVHGGYMVGTHYMTRVAYDFHENDVYWSTSDIGWIVGHSSIVYGPLANGVTVLVREGAPDYPDPGAVWGVIERYGVNTLFTAPTTLRMFMQHGELYPARYDLSSLKLLICAGEPLNPEALAWTHRNIMQGRGPVNDHWWQTETPAPTIATFPTMEQRPGHAGKPAPGVEAAVVDEAGNPVPPNTGGLLVLRRPFPHMMRTIYRAPERYEEYWNKIAGSYLTGDVATVDEDGYIAVLGRADDVLNVAGHRIGTAEVEHALVSHPAIAEAAAIGKPDSVKGEVIKVFIVLRPGHIPSQTLTQELIEHVRRELGPIAAPAELQYVPSVPKTRSGKILRRVLKAHEQGMDPGDLTTIEA